MDPTNVPRQIANSHTLFNIVNVCILLPFSNYIVKLALKIFPITAEEEEENYHITKFLDERILETPSIALTNTIDEVVRMSSRSTRALRNAYEAVSTGSPEKIKKAFDYEKIINGLQLDITNFLFKLSTKNLSDVERIKTDILFHIVNDIERVGDHAENIAEIAQLMIDKKVTFSESGRNELQVIYDIASQNFYDSITAIKTNDYELAKVVAEREKELNHLEAQARATHMNRLYEGRCSVEAGIYFIDIISNLERISDHSINIIDEINRMQGKI